MGQYKVPQDVEAEDKIIGFLTLKQFIYCIIGIVYAFLTFQLLKGVIFIYLVVGIPPTIIFLLLGLYQRDGQPFEAYFLALASYWFKPRRRIWIKEDVIEIFKVEEPKIVSQVSQRNPEQVRGQLEKLAEIVDTRGWASKQPELQDPELTPVIDLSDRLATNELAAPALEPSDVNMADDILDFQNNPSAQNLNVLIQDSEKSIHKEVLEKIQHELPQKPPPPAPPQPSTSEMTTNPIADILKRAMENTDLKVSQVSQIAAQASQQNQLVEGQSLDVRSKALQTPAPQTEILPQNTPQN